MYPIGRVNTYINIICTYTTILYELRDAGAQTEKSQKIVVCASH